jgi:hypothetical protein
MARYYACVWIIEICKTFANAAFPPSCLPFGYVTDLPVFYLAYLQIPSFSLYLKTPLSWFDAILSQASASRVIIGTSSLLSAYASLCQFPIWVACCPSRAKARMTFQSYKMRAFTNLSHRVETHIVRRFNPGSSGRQARQQAMESQDHSINHHGMQIIAFELSLILIPVYQVIPRFVRFSLSAVMAHLSCWTVKKLMDTDRRVERTAFPWRLT